MKNSDIFSVCIAQTDINYRLLHREALPFFDEYRISFVETAPIVSVSERQINTALRILPTETDAAGAELAVMAVETSSLLLQSDACIFHALAFAWRDRIWLLTAPSGTGKTTQYVRWKLLYGDEIRLLNGDKPIVRLQEDGSVWVYPSPWKGKEGIGQNFSGKLGGIIYLRQGEQNTITPLSVKNAILPLFRQFVFSPKDGNEVKAVSRIEEAMLQQVPVFLLTNRGDEESAKLTHDTLSEVFL